MTKRKRRQNLAKCCRVVAAFLCKAEWINEIAPKWTYENNFLKKSSNYRSKMWYKIDVSWKNCCIHPPKRIEAVWFQHCSRESELKRAENKVEAADGMWFNNNESNNWESDHSTYFGLRFILFEHLELLEHRATLTAGKTKLFCVVYSRKNFVLSGCQCLFSLILVVNHRKRVTHY